MSEIEIENMSSGYFGKTVLHDITLSISDPGIYIVLGKNGAGKTTLFRTLTGMLRPYKGTLTIDGSDPFNDQKTRQKCVYLSHQSAVPITMKVGPIMDMFAVLMEASQQEKEDAIERMELTDLLSKSYISLSQGQKKRVSIAKCLMKEREIYLFDEPTSNIDPIIAGDVRHDILDISRDKIVFYSSHNLYEAREIGKQVIIIDEGSIAYKGDIDAIPMGKYTIGIRAKNLLSVYPDAKLQGRYYILELGSPDEVSDVIQKLAEANIRVQEVREMSNPLEDLLK